jgi:ERCC4-type nuclease
MLIDCRTGSGVDKHGNADLPKWLEPHRIPVDATVTMPAGDVAFIGNGPDGSYVTVGIEVKKLSDVLQCVQTGRFAQLRTKLHDPGTGFQYRWLLIEGLWKPDEHSGVMLQPRNGEWQPVTLGYRRFMYRELDAWIITQTVKGGVHYARTGNRIETAQFLADLYRWWTAEEYEDHRSHLALPVARPDFAQLRKPSATRMMYAQLPHIGWEKSKAIEAEFPSMEALVDATPKQLEIVPGIGRKLAFIIWETIHGRTYSAQ